MKWRTIGFFLTCMLIVTTAFADEVTDCLERALALHKAGKSIEAKAEIEKALELIDPIARKMTPKAEVKDGVYVNYEHRFRVSAPGKNWKVRAAKTRDTRGGANVALCQMTHFSDGEPTPDAVILFARDLRVLYRSGYGRIQADKMKFMKGASKKDAGAIAQFTDVEITGQREITVGGLPAVRTEYTCKKGAARMNCFAVHVIRDHVMFTGIFIGTPGNQNTVGPAFERIVKSIDLSPIATPKK